MGGTFKRLLIEDVTDTAKVGAFTNFMFVCLLSTSSISTINLQSDDATATHPDCGKKNEPGSGEVVDFSCCSSALVWNVNMNIEQRVRKYFEQLLNIIFTSFRSKCSVTEKLTELSFVGFVADAHAQGW